MDLSLFNGHEKTSFIFSFEGQRDASRSRELDQLGRQAVSHGPDDSAAICRVEKSRRRDAQPL